jgi:hypothetical protein
LLYWYKSTNTDAEGAAEDTAEQCARRACGGGGSGGGGSG